MRKIFPCLRFVVAKYLAWGWPIVLVDAAFEMSRGDSSAPWRTLMNTAAFAWIVCAPAAPISLLLSRERRERAMSRLCGLREDDEREKAVTGEAARATLLLALSLEAALLAMSLLTVSLTWNPRAAKGEKHGLFSVGLAFSSSRHLDPFGTARDDAAKTLFGAPSVPLPSESVRLGGYLLSPSSFPVLSLLILIQLAAFKAFSGRRYEGVDS